MTQIDYPKLQARYPGLCIALRDDEVVAAELTYEALVERLNTLNANRTELTIMYVYPPDIVAIY
jgi:hypothetical protein